MERRKRIALVAHDTKPLQCGNAPALVVAVPSSTRPALMTKIPKNVRRLPDPYVAQPQAYQRVGHRPDVYELEERDPPR